MYTTGILFAVIPAMIRKAIFSGIFLLWTVFATAQELADEQLNYPRVREAYEDYDASLRQTFADRGLAWPPKEIYLRGFKFDKELELWASDGGTFRFVKTYSICEVSGELGPKRRQGDGQIPEGFYHLEAFNPVSNYHLSLKIDYPNAADRILGYRPSLGGDIFIHGDCVTIGCIPIRDEPIKELYWLSVVTREQGGEVPIHIFPFRMDAYSLRFFERLSVFSVSDWAFWKQLIPVYRYFEQHRRLPVVEVDTNGQYHIRSADTDSK